MPNSVSFRCFKTSPEIIQLAVMLYVRFPQIQGEMKKAGRPWEIGKAFEHSAPCGPLHLASDVGHPTEGDIVLTVNGELRQKGNLNQMIWKVPDMIAYLSAYYELAPGDVILAGTPSGVGPVQKGDVMRLSLEPFGHLEVAVT